MSRDRIVPLRVTLYPQELQVLNDAYDQQNIYRTRGRFADAVLAQEIPLLKVHATLGRRGVKVYLGVRMQTAIELCNLATESGYSLSSTVRLRLFGNSKVSLSHPDKIPAIETRGTPITVSLSNAELQCLDSRISCSITVGSRGDVLSQILRGEQAPLSVNCDIKERTKPVVLYVPGDVGRTLRYMAEESQSPTAYIVRTVLLPCGGNALFSRKAISSQPFIELRLLTHEVQAIKDALVAFPDLGNWGGVLAAAHEGNRECIGTPIPVQSWKNTNCRFYLPNHIYAQIRNEIEAFPGSKTDYLLRTLFGDEYKRQRKNARTTAA